MITKDNLKDVVTELLTVDEIWQALDAEGDYVLIELCCFNAGCIANITSHHPDDELEQEAADNGNLWCDKDDFIRLCKEVGHDVETIQIIANVKKE